MGTLLNRRRYMGGVGSKEWPLKYWLSGEDAPVNSKWVDRLNSNIQWSIDADVEYDSVNKLYYLKGKQYKGSMLINDGYSKYDLGYHFKMIVSGTMLETSQDGFLIDFGSVTTARKLAMGWGFHADNKWRTNYKLSGNNTAPLYDVVMDNPILEAVPFDFTVEYGCEAVSETTSRMYLLYEDEYYYGPIYNNTLLKDFNVATFYIGKGYAGISYGCNFYLKDWKIYVEPYT